MTNLCFNTFCVAGGKTRHVQHRATKRKPSARGYNWVTLFLGDINTGTWPSRLGESQELG
jgi:hypothetical protein